MIVRESIEFERGADLKKIIRGDNYIRGEVIIRDYGQIIEVWVVSKIFKYLISAMHIANIKFEPDDSYEIMFPWFSTAPYNLYKDNVKRPSKKIGNIIKKEILDPHLDHWYMRDVLYPKTGKNIFV